MEPNIEKPKTGKEVEQEKNMKGLERKMEKSEYQRKRRAGDEKRLVSEFYSSSPAPVALG